ncbi:MAG: 4a-hydroxytetrahydrobiopterin dehydratase, partial [Pseudomonadota bacterium]
MTTLSESLAANGWTLSDDGKAISKTYRFASFRDAMAWMVRAGFGVVVCSLRLE